VEQGYRTATEVFGAPRREWPDGIVVTDDMMTRGALVALQNMGVRVGEDVEIATHANRGSKALLGYDHRLTLVEVDPARVVSKMFGLLETLMDGGLPAKRLYTITPRLRQLSPKGDQKCTESQSQ